MDGLVIPHPQPEMENRQETGPRCQNLGPTAMTVRTHLLKCSIIFRTLEDQTFKHMILWWNFILRPQLWVIYKKKAHSS